MVWYVFFFFQQKTAYEMRISDWSSDVCSSDLLIVVSGLVGSGKTHLLRRIEDELARAGKVAVAKSLAVDKRRTSLPSLIEALFYDLSPGDRAQVKIPKQAERRERDLRDIMRKGKCPVVLNPKVVVKGKS